MHGSERVVWSLLPQVSGCRSEFLTDTRGEGILAAVFERYEPMHGDIPQRNEERLCVMKLVKARSTGFSCAG